MAHHAGARHAVRVADRDGAAIDVEDVVVDAQPVAAVERLHGEGLVELPQVDVVDAQAVTLQQPGYGEGRADAHLVGLTASHGEAADGAQRLKPALLGEPGVHHHAGRGTV